MTSREKRPSVHWRAIDPSLFGLEELPVGSEAFSQDADRTIAGDFGLEIERPVASAAEDALDSATLNAIREHDLPIPAGVHTAHDAVRELLRQAAEVEHALLVEYLYARFSVDRGRDYATVLSDVALEEMGHLMTVQNLLLSIGEQPYFGRQDDTPDPDSDPFPFTLGSLSKLSLAKFVVAEMPELNSNQIDDELRPTLEIMRAEVKSKISVDPNRVGILYLALYWFFQADDNPQGPCKIGLKTARVLKSVYSADKFPPGHATNFKDIAKLQAEYGEWSDNASARLDIHPVGNHQQALEAICDIMQEGEGPIQNSNGNSHFERFFERYRAWDTDPPRIQNWPENPANQGAQGSLVRLLADLFNIRYELMVLDLYLWLSYLRDDGTANSPSTNAATRAQFSEWAVREMKNIKQLSGDLTFFEAEDPSAPGSTRVGAPPFRLPSGIPPGYDSDGDQVDAEILRQNRVKHMFKLLGHSDRAIAALRENPDVFDVEATLNEIEQIDADRRAHFQHST